MAVCAVIGERVSAVNSLRSGKFSGMINHEALHAAILPGNSRAYRKYPGNSRAYRKYPGFPGRDSLRIGQGTWAMLQDIYRGADFQTQSLQ